MLLKAKLNRLDKKLTMELAQNVIDYSQHLSTTIDDFREFFKQNKEKRETSCDEVVISTLHIVEESIKNKNIKIVKELNSSQTFRTYPNELKQVVLNLIKNAEDILLDKKIEDGYISIRTYEKDGCLNIIVEDNAGGVPEDIIDKIFDPYFSTKTKKDGTGLGLYMSKIIIEEHCKGKIEVKNGKNGAVFKISIPKEENS
jgi:signal transduction histidine kinase